MLLKQKNTKECFLHIDHKISSTASILMQYVRHFKLPITEKIANPYCYAIITETNGFKRNFFQKEMELYKQIYSYANPLKIASIENVEREEDYFFSFKKALNRYHIKDNQLICRLGNIPNTRIVAEVADFFLRKKNIDFIIVTAQEKKERLMSRFSLRSKKKSIHIGKTLADIHNQKLFCGGHKEMGAGLFYDTEKKLIRLLEESFKNTLKK